MNYTDWCKLNGISLVSVLQQSFENVHEKRSTVLLIRDRDGIFKILKEVYDYKKDIPGYLNEDELYERLPKLSLFPYYHGTVDIENQKFIKISFTYGQPLSDYCQPDNLLAPNDAFYIIYNISLSLDCLRLDRLLYLDLKPENILISAYRSHFIDFGLSRFIISELQGIMTHPRYVAPETVHHHKISEKSVVFQLGIIAHELLTGKHPFDVTPDEPRTMDWNECVMRHLPALREESKVKDEFLSKMLRLNPADRPTLWMCSQNFSSIGGDRRNYIKRKGIKISGERYVLFPARMGVPHKGHIEYMSRILDLGYKLIISIQRSYTITDRDPIPKWLVMKMVARSLLNLGYSNESFKIFLTPFYRTNAEMKMHFAMMPKREKIIAMASSNPDIHKLFPDIEIIEQQHVFCTEHEVVKFMPKSWGKIFRNSIKNNDKKTFEEYTATGVEEILSFEELQTMYGKPNIELVPGIVRAVLLVNDDPVFSTRVSKYMTPEESLIQAINDTDDICKMVDPYSKDTSVQWNDEMMQISYGRTEFDDNDEMIYFKLKREVV